MKKIIFLIMCALCFSVAHAESEHSSYIFSNNIVDRFKITEVSPYKNHYLRAMRFKTMGFGLNDSDNIFCAVGYKLDNGRKVAVIFWDKGKIIILWRPEEEDFSDYIQQAVTISMSPVVEYDAILPRKELTMGMINYYAKEDVDPMRKDCKSNGEIITIKAFPTTKACKDNRLSFDCIDGL